MSYEIKYKIITPLFTTFYHIVDKGAVFLITIGSYEQLNTVFLMN